MTDPTHSPVSTTLRKMSKESMPHYSTEADRFYFFGGWASSFAPYPFEAEPYWPELKEDLGWVWYPSREHYFQAHKTIDPVRFMEIVLAGSPAESKRLGLMKQATKLISGWDDGKSYAVMLEGIKLQLAEYPDLRAKLAVTGDQPVAEDSPWDYIWGIRDKNGGFTGKNLLGKAWMEARETLSN